MNGLRLALVLCLGCRCFGLNAQSTSKPQPSSSGTLDRIRHAGTLQCGLVQEDAEYNSDDDHSSRATFDQALCSAIAIAVDPHIAVNVTSFLDEASAVDALRAGKIDLIASLSSDAEHPAPSGTRLSSPVLVDALGLMVPVSSGIEDAGALAGKKICVLAETASEDGLRSWYAQRHLDLLPFPFQEQGEMEAAFLSGNCAAIAGKLTRLALLRQSLGHAQDHYRVLPENLSQEPLAMATRGTDTVWSSDVAAVLGLLVRAAQLKSGKTGPGPPLPAGSYSLVASGITAESDLRTDWARGVLAAAGNYCHMFGSPVALAAVRLQMRMALPQAHCEP